MTTSVFPADWWRVGDFVIRWPGVSTSVVTSATSVPFASSTSVDGATFEPLPYTYRPTTGVINYNSIAYPWDGTRMGFRTTWDEGSVPGAGADPEALRRAAAARARVETLAESRREADARAEALLAGALDDRQRDQLRRSGYFDLAGASGRRYRVKRGRTCNVLELGADGAPRASYCLHPVLSVPDPDTMLTQKLMIESDEALFLRLAVRRAVAQTAGD